MISPLSSSAISIPRLLLPDAVGPTMAMTGVSEGTQQYYNPDESK